MNNRWILACTISAILAACSQTQDKTGQSSEASQKSAASITLLEQSMPAVGEVGIPYKKYQLNNGLTVILHQDKSDPLVHVDVTYHVGSARELNGRSGFAHLFEHMMFQGSQHVADEQHFKLITEAGGSLNGTTNTDRTNYFETVPSNQLEKMLWLEADRMGFLLPAITDEKFELQRETVKNERAQRVDNQPYGRLNERFNQALYPEGHPYSWPVIGWPDDLNRASTQDVKQFFTRWYGPNNATLTIGGDFDEQQALAWVGQYFADIPKGPEVKPQAKTLVTLDKTRYISMEDKVHLPLIYIGFPTVYAGHPDEAPLDLLANILGGGKTSLFYKNLVKQGYAVQASVNHPCQELACQLSLYALANPSRGGKLSELEQLIVQSIAEFEQRGVTDEDLQKVKVQFKASTIFTMQSVSGKVATLASNQTFFGTPDLLAEDLARYQNVTKADVMRVFATYIKNKPMAVMSVVPEGGKSLIASEDNFTPATAEPAQSAVELAANAKTTLEGNTTELQSNFDRSVIPKAGVAPVMTVPSLWRETLSNGIEVMGTQSLETPTVELLIYLEGGHGLAPVAKAGLAGLTAAMLNESSTLRSTEALAQALELLGSDISFGSSDSQSYIKISSLTENLSATLAIVEEKLFSPALNNDDFERLKEQQLQNLQHLSSDPNYLANQGFAKLLYGDETSLGVSNTGTLASVSAITLLDVQQFYQTQYSAAVAKMVVVSDLNKAEVIPMLKGFSKWQATPVEQPKIAAQPVLASGKIHLIDKPGSAQSVIYIGKRALPYDATGDYFKAYLMNYPLGGAFNSRINLNLREDKGYTYGARSQFSGDDKTGQFLASASVRTDVTGLALIEFIKEIKAYQAQGMTAAERDFMQNSIAQSQALDYETPYQKAGFVRMIQRYDLADDFTAKQDAIIKSVSLNELNKLAQSQLVLDNMTILIVGDKAALTEQLKDIGYPIQLMN
ncbi:pitrilysin family protein [Shewanella sp. SR44-3]|uniref:M16 family metallopeptidase n=1 Tax=Shewanella sp. SR44-3 TaxID=2760936 RepID=UPI0015FCE6C6|nr:pitrilysin family protein [Shewanella sp. SR44-3]MBB1269182.1 insulinase family protein [Shewanella sp. SR44-3]